MSECSKLAGIIVAPSPFDAELPRQPLVDLAHANPFDAAQLIDRAAHGRILPETDLKHPPHDPQTRIGVKRGAALPKELVGTGSAGLPSGIEAHARLADPDQQRSGRGRERDGRMAGPRARFEHDRCEPADGYDRAHARHVDEDEGTIQHVKLTLLDKDDRGALLEGNG